MKKKVYMLLLALGTILLCSCQNQPVSESKSDGQTEENSVEIDLTGNSAECTSKAVEVSEGKVRITDEGTYTLSGTLEGSVIINKVREAQPGFGFDAYNETYVNMVEAGILDPVKVTRSALQNDGFVNKISEYISKKVADKLSGMCKTKREDYEKYWDNISPFIKFGCLKDEKFCDKMKDAVLFKNLDHKYLTLKDCIEANGGTVEDQNAKTDDQNTENKEEDKTVIYYVTDEIQQSQYINMFKNQGMDAVILGHNIDSPFITQLEQRNQNIKFQRIDADVTAGAKEEVAEEEKEAFQKKSDSLVEIFRKELGNENLDVKIEKLKDENVASMMTLSEENRRMQEMMKMYGMNGMDMGTTSTLILNANHPLVQYVVEHKDSENTSIICKQLYDLAMLAHKPLSPEEMTAFVQRSNEIMMLLTK